MREQIDDISVMAELVETSPILHDLFVGALLGLAVMFGYAGIQQIIKSM